MTYDIAFWSIHLYWNTSYMEMQVIHKLYRLTTPGYITSGFPTGLQGSWIHKVGYHSEYRYNDV